jgi:DNA-binding CsgD family transcriptional regulator
MEHLILFAYLVTLLVGTVAITVTVQGARSGRHTALRPLTGFLICYNLMSLTGFTTTYVMISLGSPWEHGATPVWLAYIIPFMRICFFGLVWFMLLVERELRGEGDGNGRLRHLRLGAVLFVLIYLAVFLTVLLTAPRDALTYLDLAFALAAAALLMASLVSLFRFGRRLPEGEERRLITSLALAYLVLFGALLVIILLPQQVGLVVDVVVLVLINLFPVWWLARRVPLPRMASGTAALDAPSVLERLGEHYGLTEREREVAGQILLGASNKEIEDRLYISLNTVKNHIYRIFRKVGVNSRSQFIRRVLEVQRPLD